MTSAHFTLLVLLVTLPIWGVISFLGCLYAYRLYRYMRSTSGDKTASGLRLLKVDWFTALQPEQWEQRMRDTGNAGFVDQDLSEQAGFADDGKVT